MCLGTEVKCHVGYLHLQIYRLELHLHVLQLIYLDVLSQLYLTNIQYCFHTVVGMESFVERHATSCTIPAFGQDDC